MSDILQLSGGRDEEAKDLLERNLTIDIRTLDINTTNVAMLCWDFVKKLPPGVERVEHLRKAVAYCQEARRFSNLVHGPGQAISLDISLKVSIYLNKLSISEV